MLDVLSAFCGFAHLAANHLPLTCHLVTSSPRHLVFGAFLGFSTNPASSCFPHFARLSRSCISVLANAPSCTGVCACAASAVSLPSISACAPARSLLSLGSAARS